MHSMENLLFHLDKDNNLTLAQEMKTQTRSMEIELIQGQFEPQEIIDILTQMIHVKIKYHEQKIHDHSSEEDIKTRETKIKNLQKQLYEARMFLSQNTGRLTVHGNIQIG